MKPETRRIVGWSMKLDGKLWGSCIEHDFFGDINLTLEKAVRCVNAQIVQAARTVEHESPEKLELIDVLRSLKFKVQHPSIIDDEFDDEGNIIRP